MEMGEPVLCSDSSCFPEIAGEAALYFDPDVSEAVADAMGRIWSIPEIRLDLIEKGRKRRSLFSWDKTARATWDVYNRVIKKE
jgi:glycosyltransferase involved in cell wall biosynthesis